MATSESAKPTPDPIGTKVKPDKTDRRVLLPTVEPFPTPVLIPPVVMERVPARLFVNWISDYRADIIDQLSDFNSPINDPLVGVVPDLSSTLDDSRWNPTDRPQACYAAWLIHWNDAVRNLGNAVDARMWKRIGYRLLPFEVEPQRSLAAAKAEFKRASDEGVSGVCENATPTGPWSLSHPTPPPVYRPYEYSPLTGRQTSHGHHPDWFLAVYAQYQLSRTPLQAAVDDTRGGNKRAAYRRALIRLSEWDYAFATYMQWEIVPEPCYADAARTVSYVAYRSGLEKESYEVALEATRSGFGACELAPLQPMFSPLTHHDLGRQGLWLMFRRIAGSNECSGVRIGTAGARGVAERFHAYLQIAAIACDQVSSVPASKQRSGFVAGLPSAPPTRRPYASGPAQQRRLGRRPVLTRISLNC